MRTGLGLRRRSVAGHMVAPLVVAMAVAGGSLAAIAVPSRAQTPRVRPAETGPLADFNGDGFHDLAVGVPFEDVVAGGTTYVDAGQVQVVYGSADGLNGDAPIDDQVWHQGSRDVLGDLEADDRFGAALAWGDFDGDGYDDLAVAATAEDHDASTIASGAVNVLFGSPSGLTGTGSQFLEQGGGGILDAPETNDFFGTELAAANFGRGGQTDLAIGTPYEDLPGSHGSTIQDAGAVNVVYGSSGGLTASGNQFWSECTLGCLPGAPAAEQLDQFGWSLAAANFGNGAAADLAVGIPSEDIGSSLGAGAVDVIYGSAGGLTDTGRQHWTADMVAGNGIEDGDNFGYELAAADVGLTPHKDLAIGLPGERVNTEDGAGAAIVVFGSANGLASAGSQWWNLDSPGVPNQANQDDSFGKSLVAANFGNGPPADLAIGFDGVSDAGAVIVLYGTTTGLTGTGAQAWDQDSPGIADRREAGDEFGGKLAAADFGMSAEADLAVGVALESLEGGAGTVFFVGGVNVLYGTPSGLSAIGNQFWWQRGPVVKGSPEQSDQFGAAIA
jgi:FG-GAP repeat protein